MRNSLFLLLLLAPLAVAAQEAPSPAKEPYAPGKWYAGLKWERVQLGHGSYVVSPYRLGLLAGYGLLPRLAVQVGITPVYLKQLWKREPGMLARLPAPFDAYTGDIYAESPGAGVYVPLLLRYSFARPYRRFQPYVLAGAHGYFAGLRRNVYRYENGSATGSKTAYSGKLTSAVGILGGFGLRLRVIDRFSLYGELLAGRTLRASNLWTALLSRDGWPSQRSSYFSAFTGQMGVGIVYDFR